MAEFLSSTFETALPLLIALGLGAVVGWERESWSKPAGFRTHMLVALGASAFTLLAFRTTDATGGDPSRVIAGVVTGLGFLGAGSILQARFEVRGLTTAAGIWVVGGVGACCGAGQYELAITTVLFAFLILSVLRRFEDDAG
jgi:putative Mg2+ transporter-C (MgtC) family protein